MVEAVITLIKHSCLLISLKIQNKRGIQIWMTENFASDGGKVSLDCLVFFFMSTPSEKSPKRSICRFFRRNGTCKYGDECHFSHDVSSLGGGASSPLSNRTSGKSTPVNTPSNSLTPSKSNSFEFLGELLASPRTVCTNFVNFGRCKYGDECRNAHPIISGHHIVKHRRQESLLKFYHESVQGVCGSVTLQHGSDGLFVLDEYQKSSLKHWRDFLKEKQSTPGFYRKAIEEDEFIYSAITFVATEEDAVICALGDKAGKGPKWISSVLSRSFRISSGIANQGICLS